MQIARLARRLALNILAAVARLAPASRRAWAAAMVAEAAHLDDDAESVSWSLGAIRVLMRCIVAERLHGRAIGAGLAGVCAALAVVLISVTVRDALAENVSSASQSALLSIPVFFIVIPEIVFVAGIVVLWKHRRATAVGVVATAFTLASHAALHLLGR